MKVKVVKKFRDKHTKDLHEINKTLTISKERYEEINSTAQGVFVKEIIGSIIYANEKIVFPDLEAMSKKEVIDFAKEYKGIVLSPKLTKAEMIESIEAGD